MRSAAPRVCCRPSPASARRSWPWSRFAPATDLPRQVQGRMPLQPTLSPTGDPDAAHPGESTDDGDSTAPLPAPSGPSRAVLMLVHPRLLFLYWVIDGEIEERLRRPGLTTALVVEVSADGRTFRETDRRGFHTRAPCWDGPNPTVDFPGPGPLRPDNGGPLRAV